MNELANKSKGLKKVMQPRMAYKYGPRDQSTGNLINMAAQSTYAFSGRKESNMGRTDALNLYNRRSKSIVMSIIMSIVNYLIVNGPMSPSAAPSSGVG